MVNVNDSFIDHCNYALDGLQDISVPYKHHHQLLVCYLNPWKDGYGNIISIVINVRDQNDNTRAPKDENTSSNYSLNTYDMDNAGSWEYSVNSRSMVWSKRFKELLEIPQLHKATFRRTMVMIHKPEDEGTTSPYSYVRQ